MQDIINKRSELLNYLKQGEKNYTSKQYSKKEILNKEFSAISFSIRDEYIDSMVSDYDDLLTDLSIANIDDAEELYVKGIITDVDNKQGYSIIHIQNKNANQSISCSQAVVNKYGNYFETGHVIIVKCHCYKHKLYMHFLIDISTDDSFMMENDYINGNSNYLIQNINTHDHIALVKQATYFISGAGNKCLRLLLVTPVEQKTQISCKTSYNPVFPEDIVAGMFIKYEPSNETFINNIKQTYI